MIFTVSVPTRPRLSVTVTVTWWVPCASVAWIDGPVPSAPERLLVHL